MMPEKSSSFDAGTTTILVSGFGLGFYIPGLLLRSRLEALGESVDAEVFESLFDAPALEKVSRNRESYRANFSLAKTAQRVPFDVRDSIDPARRDALLDRWQREGRRNFIALSGHWIHILDAYRERVGGSIDAVLLHMDGKFAPSWLQTARLIPGYAQAYRETFLYRLSPAHINFMIETEFPAPAWRARSESVVVHGGGWGLGTFEESVTELAGEGLHIVQACYDADRVETIAGRTLVADQPTWRAWHKDSEGRLQFPPSGVVDETGWHERAFAPHTHAMHQLIGQGLAVVSKPGAGTLIDCLSTRTPLVMLDPFGEHEAASGRIWSDLGLGIQFDDWKRSGFSRAMLDEIRGNLDVAAESAPDLANEMIRTFREGVPA